MQQGRLHVNGRLCAMSLSVYENGSKNNLTGGPGCPYNNKRKKRKAKSKIKKQKVYSIS